MWRRIAGSIQKFIVRSGRESRYGQSKREYEKHQHHRKKSFFMDILIINTLLGFFWFCA